MLCILHVRSSCLNECCVGHTSCIIHKLFTCISALISYCSLCRVNIFNVCVNRLRVYKNCQVYGGGEGDAHVK